MGNSQNKGFSNRNWQFQRRQGNYDIMRSKQNGMHAQKHIIQNNQHISQADQMQLYHFRNQTNKPIVQIYNAEYIKNKGGACSNAQNIQVISQYIPYRLSDIRNLNYGQALYVLSQALYGFHELHYRFGPFQITQDHIGFNQVGQCKVWHSPNFATNHLDNQRIILMSTENPKSFDDKIQRRQQQQMVEDVWFAVRQHANINPQFAERANNFQQKSFAQARTIVLTEISRNNTFVPAYLNFGNNSNNMNHLDHSQYVLDNRPTNAHIQSHSNIPMNQQNTGNTGYQGQQYNANSNQSISYGTPQKTNQQPPQFNNSYSNQANYNSQPQNLRPNQQSYSNIPYDPRSLNSQVQNYQIQGGMQAGGNQSIVAPYGHPATTVDNSY